MTKTIRIIQPSGPDQDHLLSLRCAYFESRGFNVLCTQVNFDPQQPLNSASITDRANLVWEALTEKRSDIILCHRGGYGASDICGLIPWSQLRNHPKKWVVGFSDISTIHTCLFNLANWKSIHGPMPGSALWQEGGKDEIELFEVINGKQQTHLQLHPITNGAESMSCTGVLFGGCLSVLTSMIGTPFMPQPTEDMILFAEDVGENSGQICRHFNQWLQAGYLRKVKAIILGKFTKNQCNQNTNELAQLIAARIGSIPIWKSDMFGHASPNMPLVIGSQAKISDNNLICQDFN